MSRISELKQKAFDNGENPGNGIEKSYWVNKAILECPVEYAHNIRRAKIDCMLFDNYSIEIDSQELLVGRFSHDYQLTSEQKEVVAKGTEILSYFGDISGTSLGGTGHRVIDYEKLLKMGIKGVLSEIDVHIQQIDYSDTEASAKKAFYSASKLSLEGVCRFAKRFHTKLMDLFELETDSIRKAEYRMIADNFSRAPYEPCNHFYEALQCMWFLQFCLALIGDTSLTGRIDNYMYPYYKKDLDDGILTKEFAFELIESLFLKHNEIYGNWPASVMVGGVDRQGNVVWNEISYMCIQAIETTGLINPSVAVCYNEEMPEDLLLKCIDIISKGYTKPSIFNDRVVQEGLLDAGVSIEDSRYYIHSTCVEITPIGSSNIMVATPYINLNKAIEYILNNKSAIFGEPCHVEPSVEFNLSELVNFEQFYDLVKKVVAGIIRSYMGSVCDQMYTRERYTSSPLASAFLNDCLVLGKDAVAGGAKYNYVYPCFPGFLNLVDTLAAIECAVYQQKIMSLKKLSELCKNNFEDEERLRQYLLNKCPKFGNGIEESDRFGVEMYELIRQELKKYKISIGGDFHPSYFAWVMHGILGAVAAATPDGRKQGEALSECLGAVQGMDKNGPIGVMRSIEKIDQKYGIGGIATNFRFSKSFICSDEGKRAVANFVKVFMHNNCFEIQFNVIDQEVLQDAQKHPEKYKTLMVRVAGYSDYFVNLIPEIQNEIIKRSEHDQF